MGDTIHQIFQDGDAYKVRITRLGEFTQGQTASLPTLTRRRGLRRLSVLGRSEPAPEADIFATHAGGVTLPAAIIGLTYSTH